MHYNRAIMGSGSETYIWRFFHTLREEDLGRKLAGEQMRGGMITLILVVRDGMETQLSCQDEGRRRRKKDIGKRLGEEDRNRKLSTISSHAKVFRAPEWLNSTTRDTLLHLQNINQHATLF